jgi:hypothetical protein
MLLNYFQKQSEHGALRDEVIGKLQPKLASLRETQKAVAALKAQVDSLAKMAANR